MKREYEKQLWTALVDESLEALERLRDTMDTESLEEWDRLATCLYAMRRLIDAQSVEASSD